jgi:hypothetical protein
VTVPLHPQRSQNRAAKAMRGVSRSPPRHGETVRVPLQRGDAAFPAGQFPRLLSDEQTSLAASTARSSAAVRSSRFIAALSRPRCRSYRSSSSRATAASAASAAEEVDSGYSYLISSARKSPPRVTPGEFEFGLRTSKFPCDRAGRGADARFTGNIANFERLVHTTAEWATDYGRTSHFRLLRSRSTPPS